MHIGVRVCVCICVRACVYLCVQVCSFRSESGYACLPACVRVSVCVCVFVCVCVCACVCLCLLLSCAARNHAPATQQKVYTQYIHYMDVNQGCVIQRTRIIQHSKKYILSMYIIWM